MPLFNKQVWTKSMCLEWLLIDLLLGKNYFQCQDRFRGFRVWRIWWWQNKNWFLSKFLILTEKIDAKMSKVQNWNGTGPRKNLGLVKVPKKYVWPVYMRKQAKLPLHTKFQVRPRMCVGGIRVRKIETSNSWSAIVRTWS